MKNGKFNRTLLSLENRKKVFLWFPHRLYKLIPIKNSDIYKQWVPDRIGFLEYATKVKTFWEETFYFVEDEIS